MSDNKTSYELENQEYENIRIIRIKNIWNFNNGINIIDHQIIN
jgi:hypothetical protein